MRRISWLSGCLLLLLAVPLRSAAHGLGADCKINGSRVELEAYFDDNSAARDANVRVEDARQQLIADGRTDADGRWSFARPEAGTYRVIVDAGAGHRTKLRVTVAAEADAAAVSHGPDRAAFTAYPWVQLGIGVAVLGSLGGSFWIARRIAAARPTERRPTNG